MSLSILMMSLSAALPWFARVKSPGPLHPFRYLLSRRRQRKRLKRQKYALMALAIILFGWLASVAPKEFLGHFTVFALSCVVGYYVVWNVSHALHTPLMSVTNAISGIIVVGALLQIGHGGWVSFLSFIAVLIASINIFGGFTVTQRMLKMFRKG